MTNDDDNDDDGDDLLTPVERFGWQPGEQEQVERELSERARVLKRDEVLQQCEQRQAARAATGPVDQLGRGLRDPRYRFDPDVVAKGYGAPVTQPQAAAAAPASMSREWAAYIDRRIQKESSAREKAMAAALAQTLGKDLVAVERDCAALRAEVAELHERQVELDNEINEMIRRQRAATEFDELDSRLKQLEETRAGRLRLLG